ncbi:hypothetical protein GJAV_G00251550 [Gymnothorax javanicus]|nr:hypothetical protein GJAV_G00251550 [Gymnothorax javanicus]
MAEAKRRFSFEENKPQSSKKERPQGHRLTNQRSSLSETTSFPMDLLVKEEEYKRMNAKLEAKTAELVRQAEELMRGQNEVLSTPIISHLSLGVENVKEEFTNLDPQVPPVKQPTAKVLTKTGSSPRPHPPRLNSGNRTKKALKKSKNTPADDVAVLEDFVDFDLGNTITAIEGKIEEDGANENLDDDIMPSVGNEMGSEAQIRFLKAKLRVLQEEVNRLSHEYNKKDDENASLSSRIKEVEEDRARLQRLNNIQRSQLEKHKVLAEDSSRKCEGLQHQVISLQKEIEGLKRTQKQATTNHSATEVRLNRALEEAEKFKLELNKIKLNSKDSANQGHLKMEALQTENKNWRDRKQS